MDKGDRLEARGDREEKDSMRKNHAHYLEGFAESNPDIHKIDRFFPTFYLIP
jgi:hypothetical protein